MVALGRRGSLPRRGDAPGGGLNTRPTTTDDTLYVHYTCGIVGVCNRRTTKTEWFQNDSENTSDIAKQYEQRGNFIA